ncbi:hypothetical protein RU639_005942 [Aspergillus parasiticus]
MANQEVYLLSNRDHNESQRLDMQHEVLAGFMGYELLHPSIDIRVHDGLNIADVGTGTGIWLKRLLSWSKYLPGAPSYYLHGFDISSDQFPVEPGDINFTIHDITTPFPSEHLGRYDVVHLRLFVLALPESDIIKALTNVIGLLRPTGYLQWEDADFCYTAPDRPAAKITEVIDIVSIYMARTGLSLRLSDILMKEGTRLGLQELRQYNYSTLTNPDHYEDIQIWFNQLCYAILPVILQRSGQAGNEADSKSMAARILTDMQLAYCDGAVPDLRIFTVVGKRNLEGI